jgi:hypothetical protein
MNHFFKTLALLMSALIITGNALAIDFTLTGVVDVYADIAINETAQMDFGVVLDRDGTVTLNLNDAVVDGGNDVAAGGTAQSGGYQITGESGIVVDISLESTTGGSGLALSNFTVDAGAGATTFPTTATLTGGSANLVVGADLAVTAADAAPGADQALTFTIGVTYQ